MPHGVSDPAYTHIATTMGANGMALRCPVSRIVQPPLLSWIRTEDERVLHHHTL